MPLKKPRGCYRAIPDDEAIRVANSGGYVSPTFTEWMMDGIWPEDISPKQAAVMIDYYVKLVGVDHVGIANDDMFSTKLVVDFATANASMYDDGGYMIDAFNKGATGNGELANWRKFSPRSRTNSGRADIQMKISPKFTVATKCAEKWKSSFSCAEILSKF